MPKRTFRWRNTLATLLSLLLIMAGPALAKPTRKPHLHQAPAMSLHQIHTLVGHGLITVLQGSDLLMLSEMGMAPGIDEVTKEHGASMITQGRSLIKEVLSGTPMKQMHEKGHWQEPMMGYTHELGAEVLALLDDEQAMLSAEVISPEAMKLHHVHLALNHALEMGAEGANLVMLGKMKTTGALADQTVSRGRAMAADARKLWDSVLAAAALKELPAEKGAQALTQMAQTNRIIKHGDKILKLLAEMDSLK